MKRAALGFRMHSGWGVLVAISGNAHALELVHRTRIVVADPKIPGANQPYHYAENLESSKARKYLARCETVSQELARAAVKEVLGTLKEYEIAGAMVLLASGRPLPSLEKILASHPLIHTAEGEFFRQVVRKTCEGLKIPVTAISERDLPQHAQTTFGSAATRVQRAVASMAKSLGPPWTQDHKSAALSASIILANYTAVA